MPLTEQEISTLLQNAETAGESCLQSYRFLANHEVDLATSSTKLKYVSLELQKLLGTAPVPPVPAIAKSANHSLTFPPISGILYPDDPQIKMISCSPVLSELQKSVRAGTARRMFPVGTIIPDVWTGPYPSFVYEMPLRIVHYGPVTTSSGECKDAAILLRVNASPYQLAFDKNTNVFADSNLKCWHNVTNGYLEGCSSNLLSVITEVIVDDALVKFFPPSMEELHLNTYEDSMLENLGWEYFCDTPGFDRPCPKRIFSDPSGKPQCCWLRSSYRDRLVWLVDADGAALNNNIYSIYASLMACAITA